MISYKVMKSLDLKDSVYYRIECGCGNPEHDFQIEFTHNDVIVEMILSTTIYWKNYYACCHWHERLWKRIVASFKLLFGGYIEMQGDFILREEKHIDSFIEALEEGKNKNGEKV